MRFSIIFLSFFLTSYFANAQQTAMFLPLQKPVAYKYGVPNTSTFSLPQAADSVKMNLPKTALPLNFYSTHLGVACKMELQLEKQTKIPLRIRLGSKDQVDYLEGKYNHHN